MRRTAWLAAVGAILLGGAAARASGPLAVIAYIDKVVPDSGEAPTKVQVWGTFAVAQGEGGNYAPPVYGVLHYAIEAGKEKDCRREWAELGKAAGTGNAIGWGDSTSGKNFGKVRRAGAPAGEPDTYPLGFGLQQFRADSRYAPVLSLLNTPAPAVPFPGAEVAAGKVELVARNVRAKDRAKAKYVFEIENAAGDKEASPELAAGDGETTWTPRLEVKAGEKYTWRVRALDGDWKGPTNTVTFKGKAAS